MIINCQLSAGTVELGMPDQGLFGSRITSEEISRRQNLLKTFRKCCINAMYFYHVEASNGMTTSEYQEESQQVLINDIFVATFILSDVG